MQSNMTEDRLDTERSSSSSSSSSSDEEMESSSETESESDEPVNEKITLKARKDRRSRGRWKLLSDRKVFKKEWLELFPWVEEDQEDPKSAVCRLCNTSMKALKGILESHQKSKKHMKNVAGPDYVEEAPKKETPKQPEQPKPPSGGITVDQISDDQISFFTESPADAAHQAVTSLIDKLVEKYNENRVANLKIQNEAVLQLNRERAKVTRAANQRKLELRLHHEAYMREAQDTHLKFLQLQHETKINAMEDERDAKLRAVEQELVFAKQEYEKKVRLLDSQLSSMK